MIYHSTSSRADENFELSSHNPDALVYVSGDFSPVYPVSTLFDEKHGERLTGLSHIINVPTRSKSILVWCLVNNKKVRHVVTQLPPLGSSDHNLILIKSQVNRIEKPRNKRIYKRDLRESKIGRFGQTITSFDWSEIYDLYDVNEKYN